jgi:hypothetical protein
MLLEGTDARVHFIQHNQDIEAARQRGELKPNRFIKIERPAADNRTGIAVRDFGDAEQYLTSGHLKNAARSPRQRGVAADSPAWGGWLGRYYDAIRREAEGPVVAPGGRQDRRATSKQR